MALLAAEISGGRKIKELLKRLPAAGREQIRIRFNESVDNIEKHAKEIVPVDTGTLQASIKAIHAKPGELDSRVVTDIEYAPFVEFGTVKMPAQPYLTPALLTEIPKLIKRLRDDFGIKETVKNKAKRRVG